MAIHHSHPLPFLLIPIIIFFFFFASLAATALPPPSSHSLPRSHSLPPPPPSSRRQPRRLRLPPPPPPPPAPEETTEDQLTHIIDALIGAGDFGDWAGIISSAVLPLSATIFVPENSPSGTAPPNPLMLPYHVVPQRLTFTQLLAIRAGARLPTLLPGKTLLVTDGSRLNFSIDGARVTVPDLYTTAALTVHGVEAAFDYSVYGDQLDQAPTPKKADPEEPGSEQSEVSRSPPDEVPRVSVVNSGTAPPCLCVKLPVLVLAIFAISGFKIHFNSFIFQGLINGSVLICMYFLGCS